MLFKNKLTFIKHVRMSFKDINWFSLQLHKTLTHFLALLKSGLDSLVDRREQLCLKFARSALRQTRKNLQAMLADIFG